MCVRGGGGGGWGRQPRLMCFDASGMTGVIANQWQVLRENTDCGSVLNKAGGQIVLFAQEGSLTGEITQKSKGASHDEMS